MLFRSYSSFEYFLSYFFINRSRLTNKYYFVNTYDRWAYIFGDIKHETYFIQHGILSGDVLIKKIGRVDYAYYIDKEQKDICEKILFDNVPVARYRNRMNFSGNGKNSPRCLADASISFRPVTLQAVHLHRCRPADVFP